MHGLFGVHALFNAFFYLCYLNEPGIVNLRRIWKINCHPAHINIVVVFAARASGYAMLHLCRVAIYLVVFGRAGETLTHGSCYIYPRTKTDEYR